MKKMKKLVAMLTTTAMVLGMSISSLAATITVTPPANAKGENTYTVYKVFDVTSSGDAVAYKLVGEDSLSDDMKAAGFSAANGYVTLANAGDELTAAQIAAIKGFVTEADKVGEIKTTDTTASSLSGLSEGFYYVTTTTGSAVMINTATDTATITDKNTITVVDKVAGSNFDDASKKAIASVGTDLSFTATITVGKGAHDVVFTDTMTGMTFNTSSLKIDEAEVSPEVATVEATESAFTVTFTDAYINARNTTGESTIVLTYTGKVTAEALTVDAANNTASVKTDNGNENTSKVDVFNAKLTVTKFDGKKTEDTADDSALEGAGFKLKNAEGKYYIKAADGSISWGEETAATEVMANTGDGKNVAVFTGLGVGEYTLVESTVPAGYNKADDQPISVALSDVTGETLTLEKTANVINMAGSTLPSTGGMGTTIFYAIGAILVIGAGVVLVSRRRAN
jgi:LPXTG-motif cell wall-anchored protein